MYTFTSVFLPAVILSFTEAGRIKQRILCCRKFIVIFGSSDLFIEQLLALAAECRLLTFSFRAWQKYCILSLLSLGRFSEGILINISSKKNAFVRVFTLTILWLSAILKLDFLKRSALYSTHQNHIDRQGLRLKFGHLVTCYTNERCLRCFDVFASRGFAFLLLWALLYLGDRVLANKGWI